MTYVVSKGRPLDVVAPIRAEHEALRVLLEEFPVTARPFLPVLMDWVRMPHQGRHRIAAKIRTASRKRPPLNDSEVQALASQAEAREAHRIACRPGRHKVTQAEKAAVLALSGMSLEEAAETIGTTPGRLTDRLRKSDAHATLARLRANRAPS